MKKKIVVFFLLMTSGVMFLPSEGLAAGDEGSRPTVSALAYTAGNTLQRRYRRRYRRVRYYRIYYRPRIRYRRYRVRRARYHYFVRRGRLYRRRL